MVQPTWSSPSLWSPVLLNIIITKTYPHQLNSPLSCSRRHIHFQYLSLWRRDFCWYVRSARRGLCGCTVKTKHNDRLKQTNAIPWSAGRIEISADFKPGCAPAIYGLPVYLRTLRNLRHTLGTYKPNLCLLYLVISLTYNLKLKGAFLEERWTFHWPFSQLRVSFLSRYRVLFSVFANQMTYVLLVSSRCHISPCFAEGNPIDFRVQRIQKPDT